MQRHEIIREAILSAQVAYDRTGSVIRAHSAATAICYSSGFSYAESERIARWTTRQIRTHHNEV